MENISIMKQNIINFVNQIAAHYQMPAEEVNEAIIHTNFATIYQALWRRGRSVRIFTAGTPRSLEHGEMVYNSDLLFPVPAMCLYRVLISRKRFCDLVTDRYFEVWLCQDLTITVTVCYRALHEDLDFPCIYRQLKPAGWPYQENIFDMDIFFDFMRMGGPDCCGEDDLGFYET